ncbi:hypothetical protein CPZ30_06370 [Paenibacillus lautus]|nr:hypothetical protein CPZ30_06370 [Paenibacillus lautus]
MVRNKAPLVQISRRGIWGKKVYHISEDKNIAPLRVANLAAFLFYLYKFLSLIEDKNLYRLP